MRSCDLDLLGRIVSGYEVSYVSPSCLWLVWIASCLPFLLLQ